MQRPGGGFRGHEAQLKLFRLYAQEPQTGPPPACFPGVLAPNKDREIGGGRATRQPGQVRKEAALTRSGSGRSSVSYLFLQRIAPRGGSVAHKQKARREPGFSNANTPNNQNR